MSNRATLFQGQRCGAVQRQRHWHRQQLRPRRRASAVDFKFAFNFSSLQLDLGANVQWDGRGETSSFNASYNQRVQMSDFVNAGRADSYRIEFRDEAQVLAGITGRGFNNADVLASAGVSSIDAALMPVYQPLASSLLTVLDASTFNIKSASLAIPPGGFQDDVDVFLHFLVANEGSVSMTLDGYTLAMFDDDFLFDDLIGSFSRTLNFVIPAGGRYEFGGLITLSRADLNGAVDFGEGGFLELFGRGVFRFHDVFGSREKDFRLTIPEPGSLGLVLLGGLALLFTRRQAANVQRK